MDFREVNSVQILIGIQTAVKVSICVQLLIPATHSGELIKRKIECDITTANVLLGICERHTCLNNWE